jgi:dienelactone hydrolase
MHPMVQEGANLAVRAAALPWLAGARWWEAGAWQAIRRAATTRSGWRLGAAMAADEFFYLSELLAGAPYAFLEPRRLATEVSAALECYEQSGWLDDPASFHRTPAAPDGVEIEDATIPGIWYEHLTFESGYEPWPDEPGRERWLSYAPNRTAHAWLFRHAGAGRPWLVCVPGYRMGRLLFDFVGFRIHWMHRVLGLNVAVPVLPFHGPRCVSGRSGDGYLTGDFLDTIHAQAQTVWDIRRLIAWLRLEGAPAIGAYGLSLGGYTTAMIASLERELDCVVAGLAPSDFASLLRDNSPSLIVKLSEYVGYPWSDIDRLLRVVSPLALTRRVPKDRCYLFAGMADGLAPPRQTRDLWRHWGRPRLTMYRGGHVSFVVERAVHELLSEAFTATGLAPSAPMLTYEPPEPWAFQRWLALA